MEQPTEQPPRSNLERLPLYLLYLISERLAQLEPRTRRSIFALSLTSKACCAATDPERFRQVQFAIVGPQKLLRDTRRWREILQDGHRLGCVRSVKINGLTISPSVEEELIQKDDISGSTLPVIHDQKLRDTWGRDGETDCKIPELFSGLDKPIFPNEPLPPPSTAWPDESAWKPLVDLINDLPALQDVIFASRDQFPRLLLSGLHENHPRCRLHMHYFKLRSLIHPELEEQRMHPDDVALATSPCLYSIVVKTQPYDAAQTVDYNEEAVMAMAKGMAPNLKNVSLTYGVHQSAQPPPGGFATIPWPPWKGFPVPSGVPHGERQSMGRLENLALNHDITDRKLIQWSLCTDFRHLRSLSAGPCFFGSAARRLAVIARQTPMTALSSLYLKMFSNVPDLDATVDTDVAELLQSLCPLEDLELYGLLEDKAFEAIITHHRERLRRVYFLCQDSCAEDQWKFSPERCAQLSRECPRLRSVDVREPEYSNVIYDWSDWDLDTPY